MKCSIDWNVFGYSLFMFGSIFYFVEALAPYIPDAHTDDASNVYYDGDLYENKTDAWLDICACIIFDIESTIYLIGWYIGRKQLRREAIKLRPYKEDWNFWGNLMFLVGSLAYQATAVMYYYGKYNEIQNIMNLLIAILFLVDSIFYTFAMFHGECARAPSNVPDAGRWSFHSKLDWYMLACLGFVIGSIVYVVGAMQSLQGESGDMWSMLGAVVFMIDAPLYLISAFQDRTSVEEGDISDRRYIWLIEYEETTERRTSYMLVLPTTPQQPVFTTKAVAERQGQRTPPRSSSSSSRNRKDLTDSDNGGGGAGAAAAGEGRTYANANGGGNSGGGSGSGSSSSSSSSSGGKDERAKPATTNVRKLLGRRGSRGGLLAASSTANPLLGVAPSTSDDFDEVSINF